MRAAARRLLALLACGTLLWPGSGAAGDDNSAVGNDNSRAGQRTLSQPGPCYATVELERVRQLRQQGDILPLGDILARARHYRAGRVLDTQLESESDRYVYVVELVDESGQVWEIRFDASSGELLEHQRED